MKLILGLLTIISISLRFSPALSLLSKSNDLQYLDQFGKFKTLLVDVQPIIKKVIEDIPADYTYDKYHQDLQNILKKINEKSGNVCSEKHFNDLAELVKLTKEYSKKGAPAEAKKVLRLFVKHGHRDYLKKQWFRLKKIDLAKLRENIQQMDKSDKKFKALTEMC
ncbi:uncharacterized protein LOC106094470 [Stomoxys calcitrans]|uniref:uncharacterized protein LOC106094470 n=1 Tax=Stomoxys calcitrans TaxID=35570 RepID=UPI0027E3264E|nr:uncharacterized protein LOC106094470 [Stomoxys calcitrans]